MTAPVVEQVVESATTTAGTSHVVTLPTATAGHLLLIILDKGSTSATVNAHASLTELLDEASANGLYIAYRQMDGSEPASYTLTLSAATRSAVLAYRISGHINPAVQAPQIGTTGTGTSATPDPPASAAPSSTLDYLFIAFAGMAGEEADDDSWGNTPPTNYTPSPPRQKSCGVAGVNLGGLILAAERALNTGSAQDPGTFGVDVSAAWRSQTIMITPANPITVTPGVATLTLTKFAPTVSTPVLVTPAKRSLVTTTFAPTVAVDRRVTIGTRALITTVANDPFTDTAGTLLTAHTGPNGLTWSEFLFSGNAARISDANRARADGISTITSLTASVTPPAADYSVSADVFKGTATGDRWVILMGRGSFGNRYEAYYKEISGAATVGVRKTGGADSGTGITAWAASSTHNITLEMWGSRIRCYIDGVAKTEIIDTSLTGAGYTGIKFEDNGTPTNSAGLHVDTFTVIGNAPTVLTPRVATPPQRALVTATFAPTVLTPRVATPPVAALILTTFAPVVTVPSGVTAEPATAALSLSTFAPTVLTPRTSTPATATLALATFAPTVFSPRTATPATAALTLTGFAPSVLAPRLVTPGVAALILASFAPTVLLPKLVVPGVAALALTTFAPSVLTPRLVTPATAALALTAFAPLVVASDHKRAVPGTAVLTISTFAPSVILPRLVVPPTAALTLTTFAPGVQGGSGVTVVVGRAELVASAYAPTVTVTDNRLVVPGTAALVMVRFAPTVLLPRLVTPNTAVLTLTGIAPTVLTPERVTPATAILIMTGFAPDIAITQNVRVVVGTAHLFLTRFPPLVFIAGLLTGLPGIHLVTVSAGGPRVTITGAHITAGIETGRIRKT